MERIEKRAAKANTTNDATKDSAAPFKGGSIQVVVDPLSSPAPWDLSSQTFRSVAGLGSYYSHATINSRTIEVWCGVLTTADRLRRWSEASSNKGRCVWSSI
jgi:hypothetical protein